MQTTRTATATPKATNDPQAGFGQRGAGRSKQIYAFRLTPAEWRRILADEDFLRDPDNSWRPRRLMGVPVEIVPDHRTG
jgi:hypothetical protein